MSISHQFDAYLESRGVVPDVEVVPDHGCQVFLPQPGVSVRVVDELVLAEKLVREVLG